MSSVAFHPEAEAEFIAAARYYESQAENLGRAFIAAVEATYQRLLRFSASGRPRAPAPGSREAAA